MTKHLSATSLVLLGALVGCTSPTTAPLVARVTEYGTYNRGIETIRPDASAASGQSRGSNGYRLKAITEVVPLVIGESFGFCYEVSGFASGASPSVVIETTHPAFSPPGKAATAEQLPRNVAPLDGVLTDCTGYGFDHSFELVPGRWEFTVVVDGKKVLTQSFAAR